MIDEKLVFLHLSHLQVLTYFSAKLDQEQTEGTQLSVQEVLEIIKQGMLQWPRDRLRVRIILILNRTQLSVQEVLEIIKQGILQWPRDRLRTGL